MALGIQNFMGSHVYIVVGSLIYGILEKIMLSLEDNILSPFIHMLLGDRFFDKLKWQIGKDEEDILDVGKFLADGLKVMILLLITYQLYIYFEDYKNVSKKL